MQFPLDSRFSLDLFDVLRRGADLLVFATDIQMAVSNFFEAGWREGRADVQSVSLRVPPSFC